MPCAPRSVKVKGNSVDYMIYLHNISQERGIQISLEEEPFIWGDHDSSFGTTVRIGPIILRVENRVTHIWDFFPGENKMLKDLRTIFEPEGDD